MFQLSLNILQSTFIYIHVYSFLITESEILEIYYKLFVAFLVFQMKNSVRKYFPGLCSTNKTAKFHIKESQLCSNILIVATFIKRGTGVLVVHLALSNGLFVMVLA